MIYAIGYREVIKEGQHQFIIEKHITKEEYEEIQSMLGEAKKINSMTHVYQLFERNGNEFLAYISKVNEILNSDNEQIYLEANRLLINYLSSLSMFIDYGERYNQKHFGKQKLKEFESKTHDFYDNHVSYRFMALMRNYALHYGFPLTNIRRSLVNQNGVFASKRTLLGFKSWKHAREDIEIMPELIRIEPHVEISMLFIKHLYDSYLYDLTPVLIKGLEYLNALIKRNGGKVPLLATFKDIEELKKGNISVDLIEPNTYIKVLEIIKSHPSINIIEK
ncbi:hypothetical protein [Halalkalibacter nanhaiisediminis]|uniref:Uncharacterized protein n=1 Tax=Halalkalibacter nanhaiisediminis TaxID=688079 RepID=A0A562QJZ2_9BACI|nr:hypothetical protein [Halalkalibacter nanhaiisediminis]TWI57059.1 hypothetical protein IQ10_01761 [Halalkalibacter nanhaiisediminis]